MWVKPMRFLRKKNQLGTTYWTYDVSSQVQIKQILQKEVKSKDWPLAKTEEENYRSELIPLEKFQEKFSQTIKNIKSTTLRFKLAWVFNRYPDEEGFIFIAGDALSPRR